MSEALALINDPATQFGLVYDIETDSYAVKFRRIEEVALMFYSDVMADPDIKQEIKDRVKFAYAIRPLFLERSSHGSLPRFHS
jgi:hypothetical protein